MLQQLEMVSQNKDHFHFHFDSDFLFLSIFFARFIRGNVSYSVDLKRT